MDDADFGSAWKLDEEAARKVDDDDERNDAPVMAIDSNCCRREALRWGDLRIPDWTPSEAPLAADMREKTPSSSAARSLRKLSEVANGLRKLADCMGVNGNSM